MVCALYIDQKSYDLIFEGFVEILILFFIVLGSTLKQ